VHHRQPRLVGGAADPALSVLSAVKTYRRWQRHIRWRPWLFATYAMWMLTTAYLLLSSSAVFVQVG